MVNAALTQEQVHAARALREALSDYVDVMPHTAPPQPEVAAAMSLYHRIGR